MFHRPSSTAPDIAGPLHGPCPSNADGVQAVTQQIDRLNAPHVRTFPSNTDNPTVH